MWTMSLVGYKFGYKFVSNPDPGFQSWRRKFQVEASLSPGVAGGKKRRLSRRNLAILAVAEVRFALATEEEFGRSEVWLAICGRLLALLALLALLPRRDE